MKFSKTMGVAMLAACSLSLMGAAQAEVRSMNLRWATANPAGHPIPMGGERFAKLVEEKSGGKMKVKVFPGGVLGSDPQLLSAVQGGTLDFAAMNSGILQGQIKEFAIVDFPFLFNNAQEVDAILDGAIGKELDAKLPEKGLVNLAYFDLGFRNLTNSRRPVNTADEIAGLKLLPGMPAEVYIRTGERSPMAYLIKPFADYFNRAFREN